MVDVTNDSAGRTSCWRCTRSSHGCREYRITGSRTTRKRLSGISGYSPKGRSHVVDEVSPSRIT